MMKILWLCNIVLPDFSQEFSIKKSVVGGWMTGMLHELEKKEGIDISLCFPIYDPDRRKDGECNGHQYYTFWCKNAEVYDAEMVERFEKILEKNKPDIVHIWGTEYPHTTAMIAACKNRGMSERVVINIQGLVSVCAKHYLADIPETFRKLKTEDGTSIEEEQIAFERRGKYEIESLKQVQHVIGRTDWDRACVTAINPGIQYHFCGEVLKDHFYEYAGKWRYENCQRHSIFISQASYPIKGFHYLLWALPIIIKQYPDTRVYVAGNNILNAKKRNSYSFYIENLIKRFDLSDVICFLDKLDETEMVQQYLKANVFVLPSTVENSPNSLYEAMIIGTPSIASYVGGISNRITHNINGFLYPHNEPDLLAYYVCQVFENKEDMCRRFSMHTAGKMNQFINTEMNADANLEIYKKIFKNSDV